MEKCIANLERRTLSHPDSREPGWVEGGLPALQSGSWPWYYCRCLLAARTGRMAGSWGGCWLAQGAYLPSHLAATSYQSPTLTRRLGSAAVVPQMEPCPW